MAPRVYIETTIPSYLTARPSRDLIQAARQQMTREWWDRHRGRFEIVASQLVLDECGGGDTSAASARLAALTGLPLLAITAEAGALARELVAGGSLPTRAAADALHLATATVHGVEFLLTWNCTHLANAVLRRRIESACGARGRRAPAICTPEELTPEERDDDG